MLMALLLGLSAGAPKASAQSGGSWSGGLAEEIGAAESGTTEFGHLDTLNGTCTLLSKSDPFGVFVQIALALLALFALYIKRQREQPPRAWTVWLYDIAKQCASMCCAHVGGMVNAIVLNGITHQGDECAWYFISFTVDTTVGVTIAIYAMRAVAHMARDEECKCCACPSLKETGNYGPGKFYPEGDKPSEQYVQGAAFRFDEPGAARRVWCKQMSIWCLITAGARACCGVLMYIVSDVLRHFAIFLADLFRGHPHLFLTLVRFHATILPSTVQRPQPAGVRAHTGSLWRVRIIR